MIPYKTNGKPLSIGPIAARERKSESGVLLNIPFQLHGDWRNTAEGEQILSTVSGNLASSFEEELAKKGRWSEEIFTSDNNPVQLDPGADENLIIVRVSCENMDECRRFVELAKTSPEIKQYCQQVQVTEIK